ncbi:helix-turn-helix transcriptional regulator [Tamlana fucoidanivorans]|uniref:Helix-turn-helix transcriptional regulator n=1 Tax=Allotamlana fucoidanivorans TaxID=2583814 RepID=A0A5C4SL49_9FLAO|nr:helix-turn-helix domain-containing protein [Tamlana fucoidanivorans]TNJ44688.1 helix-turn-helix transcriptional regulator [Tamlana fucoidanivorans]
MNLEGIINFLLIAGVVQGLGFNLVTSCVKKKTNKTIVFLNLTVLFISLNNLQRWLIENGYSSELFFFKNFLVPWYFLIVPMFYAFTIHFTKVQDKVRSFLKTTIIIFIVEVILRLCLMSYVYYEVPDRNTILLEYYTFIEDYFNLFYIIFLFTNACFIIFNRQRLTSYILSYDDLNWLKWFVRFGFIIIGCWAIALTVNLFTGNDMVYLLLRFSMSVLLYWLGYQGFYKYNVIKDRISLRSSLAAEELGIGNINPSSLDNDKDDFFNKKHQADFDKIKNYIIKNKLYLDPLLSMESVASELGMSKSYFSKLINSYSDYNFSDFINSLRVKQAKKFLSNDDFSDYTIVAIGLECGFNSKSTFYAAFKKFTSETPSTYRAQF